MAKKRVVLTGAGGYVAQRMIRLYRTRFLGHKFVSCGGPE